MEFDFIDNIGEGAFYLDEENEINNPLDDEHPTDTLISELEEEVSYDEERNHKGF